MGRPRKKVAEAGDIVERLRIYQDYRQYIVLMDVADLIPFAALKSVDTIFSKLGLIIKRNFGYLGFSWGYGAIEEKREGEGVPVTSAPVSLNIYFQNPITEDFLRENAEHFEKILNYLRREWAIFKGDAEEEY